MPGGEILADLSFEAEVIEWRGPAPYYFVTVPSEHADEVRYAARLASYGWGVVPVEATVGDITFRTSLFPRNGGYLLPLKASVRKAAKLESGMPAQVRMQITSPSTHSSPSGAIC
jgi:hypothetical protein